MKTFAVSTSIRSAPEAIWALLTDAAGYPDLQPAFEEFAACVKARAEAG